VKLRITIAGKAYEVEVEVLEDEESALPHEPAFVPAPSVAIFGVAETAGSREVGDRVCRSPVTGLVIHVDVAAGQAVEEGQLLMVLESMKMETQVTAPCAGVVARVHVAAGDSVKAGQVLVEFEDRDRDGKRTD
jgi:methylmalonyl-CoA carboxyltransferase small subunit